MKYTVIALLLAAVPIYAQTGYCAGLNDGPQVPGGLRQGEVSKLITTLQTIAPERLQGMIDQAMQIAHSYSAAPGQGKLQALKAHRAEIEDLHRQVCSVLHC